MQRTFIKAQYYATYYYASIVRNVLHNQFSYLRSLNDFTGDGNYLSNVIPFPKRSAFHRFIQFVIEDVLTDEMLEIDLDDRKDTVQRFASVPIARNNMKPEILPIEEFFKAYSSEYYSFDEWLSSRNKSFLDADSDDVYNYFSDVKLGTAFEYLLIQLTNEVFFILFQNRGLLLTFNQMMASYIARTDLSEIDQYYRIYYSHNGVLKRTNIPKWVKRAVYFRDHGLCVMCRRDLTGTINIGNIENFDHIVPLNKGGLNDVSNIQLLCEHCNKKKLDGEPITSHNYQDWYDMNGE